MFRIRPAFEKRRFIASFTAFQFIVALTASLVFGSLAPAYAAGGLTGNFSGTVQDSSGMPVSGATVDLVSPSGSYKQTTDGKGNFLFLNINIDTYILSVQATGFEPYGREGITVTGDSSGSIGIIKLGKLNVPKQIAVVTSRSQSSAFQPNATVPSFTVGGSVLVAAQGKTSNASEESVLLAAPGFQVDKEGGLILDGSTTDEVHFFFDGVDFTDPGFNQNGNNYFFNGISSTQIVPGAGDPSQGDAGAGAVNLVVRRGTYPGSGQVDAELLSRPFDHQFNLEYGAATKNNSVSDFFSYFKDDVNTQYGPFGSSAYDDGIFYNDATYTAENDFVNNLVFHFGKNNNQSFQFLFYNNSTQTDGNYGDAQIQYDDVNPYEIALASGITGLSTTQAQSLIAHESGEYPGANVTTPDEISGTTLLKFEYNNQLNSTTALDLRYFNANYIHATDVSSDQAGYPGTDAFFDTQTSGGSRTGAILNITKQAGSSNLLTFSANVEDARPNFSALFEPQGLFALGENAALFLRPANPNLPVSASNPCPVVDFPGTTTPNPEACYLQQYYYQQGGTPLPPAVDLRSVNLQHFYGSGLRDQLQVSSKFKLDLGLRYDDIDEGFGSNVAYEDEATQNVVGNPYYADVDYQAADHPHFLEPRIGASYRIDATDSVAFTYGKSINETGSGEQASPENFDAFQPFTNIPVTSALANIFQGGTPFGNPAPTVIAASTPTNPTAYNQTTILCNTAVPYATGASANANPSYNGSIGNGLQLGKPCANLGQLLYSQDDVYFPEIVAVTPAIFENYDFNFSHQFKDGSAVRIAPFFRQGKDIQVFTTPLVFNPATGTYQTGSIVGQPDGKQTTTGVDLSYTLPERKYGLNGFVNATYVNEFTNTPAAGDNFEGQDFEPVVLPASYSSGDMYRAGFVSPITANAGISYTTKSGFRINPVLHFIGGYPYNAGSLTPVINSQYGAINVPNTNLTDQFGSAGAPAFVDPANPGSEFKPVISATRGEKESASGGGLLSRPQVTSDLTLEYTAPGSRTTFGIVGEDLFNNGIYATPSINGAYYPVATGVAGPLTGQSVTGAVYPTYDNVVAKNTYPYGAYNVGYTNALPFTLRFYVQYKL
jgi:hypothetical protein